ncbi:SRPBCC family protein [Thalassiella azotivora]
MDLQHTFSVPVPVDRAWETFNDLERIAPCFPGAQITSVDGDDFTGTAKVRLGPISLQYSGTGHWRERDRDRYRAVIEANGKDKRGNGTAAAVITAHLEEQDGGTKVVVDTDLRITGRPAQFGRGVVQDVGAKLLDQFAACLVTRLAEESHPEHPQAAAQPPGEADRASAEQAARDARRDVGRDVGEVEPAPADDDRQDEASNVAEQAAVAAQAPRAAQDQQPPRPTPAAASPRRSGSDELDLGGVVGPLLLRRYGGTLAAMAATALVTWWLARRRR